MHEHLGTASRGTLWELRVASGPEKLRDSEWSHGCQRDTLTVCLNLVPQVTVDDS